jgi:hypothetical protein
MVTGKRGFKFDADSTEKGCQGGINTFCIAVKGRYKVAV